MNLDIHGLTFHYNSHPVLKEISCSAGSGEIMAVLGPNGAGKTTFLRCLNAMLSPRSGSVLLDGQEILQADRREIAKVMAYVPQHIEPTRVAAFDAILLGRRPHIGWDIRQEDIRKAQAIIEQLHLAHLALRPIDAISGGELQKIAIARALVQEPRVLLLDEPTSSLDLKNQHEIMGIIRTIVETHSLTALMTMHDINLALNYADSFVFFKEGKVFSACRGDSISPDVIGEVYGIPVSLERIGGRYVVVPCTGRDPSIVA